MKNNLKRVVVIGTSCSGKTTLARALAKLLNVGHIELDAIHWQLNWSPRPLEEFRALTTEAVIPEQWVLDGNYSKVRDIVWPRATTLIWLNYPFYVVFGRALRRTIKRVLLKEKLYADNRETFRQAFLSTDSILWWVIKTYRRRRREYPQLFQQKEFTHLGIPEKTVIELNTLSETEAFLSASAKKPQPRSNLNVRRS